MTVPEFDAQPLRFHRNSLQNPAKLHSQKPQLAAIEGLLFDAGDVLFDASVWQRWLLQLVSRMGLHTHYRAFFRLWQADFHDDVCCGHRDFWDALRAFLIAAGLSCGQVDEVFAAARGRHRQLAENLRLFPNVANTLALLAERDLELGVLAVSAQSGEQLRQRLESMGLAERFKVVTTSRDVGQVPPHASFYDAALSQLEAEKSKVAYVGHDPFELNAARAFGLQTVAVNLPDDITVDYSLARFEELIDAIVTTPCELLAS